MRHTTPLRPVCGWMFRIISFWWTLSLIIKRSLSFTKGAKCCSKSLKHIGAATLSSYLTSVDRAFSLLVTCNSFSHSVLRLHFPIKRKVNQRNREKIHTAPKLHIYNSQFKSEKSASTSHLCVPSAPLLPVFLLGGLVAMTLLPSTARSPLLFAAGGTFWAKCHVPQSL